MNYYCILLLIFIIITILFKVLKKDVKTDSLYLLTIMTLLILFLIIKDDSVGVDWLNYKKIFDYAHDLDLISLINHERHEIGYKLYCKLIASIYYDYYFFLGITSILSLLPVYRFIKKYSSDYFLSTLIFMSFTFYSLYFGVIRSSMALSILMISIDFIQKKKPIPFILTVLLAASFHKTALIFLPAYFLSKIKLNKKTFIIFITGASILFLSKGFLINMINKIIYQDYNPEEYASGGYSMLVILLVAFIILYIFRDKLIEKNKNNFLFINMFMMAILIQTMALEIGTLFRVTQFYFFPMITLLPDGLQLKIFDTKVMKILRYCVIIFFIVYFVYSALTYKNFKPYSFIFEN